MRSRRPRLAASDRHDSFFLRAAQQELGIRFSGHDLTFRKREFRYRLIARELAAFASSRAARPVQKTDEGSRPMMRTLYPPMEPFETGSVDVGDGHSIYYERCGTRGAKPAVFLHGGPG